MSEFTLGLPTGSHPVTIGASPSQPLFILGRNGVGKSALVHHIVQQLKGRAVYLPGARPSYFEQESLSLNPAARRLLQQNFIHWDTMPETRWKSAQGTSRNEKAVHDLTIRETQFKVEAANEIAREGKESQAVGRLQSGISPLDRANAILEQANLPVLIAFRDGELQATRNNNFYSIAKMSDGERIALVLIAEVISAPAGSVFLIDEPELHLHRAIIVPLIASIIRENPESTFIISTHELELVSASLRASVAVVRGCSWKPNQQCEWDIDVISNTDAIPEDVRTDVLGSRRKILFIEGVSTSLDTPLYALLFPTVSVRSRESCREVERVVTGLQATKDTHRADVYGLVDGDGMSAAQVSAYEARCIYPLPTHSVESFYYCEEVLNAIAQRQAETLGVDRNVLLQEANSRAIATLEPQSISHLASRVAEREFREQVLLQIPDREALKTGNSALSISVQSSYPQEISRITELRNRGDIAGIVCRYPVRESRVLNALASGLRFVRREDYESAVLSRVGSDEALREILRAKLGALAAKLT